MKNNLKKFTVFHVLDERLTINGGIRAALIQPVAELVAVNSRKGSGNEKHEIHFKRGLSLPIHKMTCRVLKKIPKKIR